MKNNDLQGVVWFRLMMQWKCYYDHRLNAARFQLMQVRYERDRLQARLSLLEKATALCSPRYEHISWHIWDESEGFADVVVEPVSGDYKLMTGVRFPRESNEWKRSL